MSIRFAFAGFRHGHIFSVLQGVRQTEGCEVVAACEEDPATRKAFADGDAVEITHDSFETMLAETDCDVVAVGDCYGRRGGILIRAMEAGKHVLSDKPICTDLGEMDRIEALARERGLRVGCQLDLRCAGMFIRLREIIASGEIGQAQSFTVLGLHPLALGVRPGWYFEPGKHGGTINDIAIHAVDAIPWLCGQEIAEIVSARAWNVKAAEFPHFNDCGQFMLRLSEGAGVIGDVSYLAPDKLAYRLPTYWRVTCHGTRGMAEACYNRPEVLVVNDDDQAMRYVPAAAEAPLGYLHDFLAEIAAGEAPGGLSTERVLRASRVALLAQRAADKNETNVKC